MEWISVEDRLPILESDNFIDYSSTKVIVTNGENVTCLQFSAGRMPKFWSRFDSSSVTHWMPLPEPPIGEDEV